MCAFLIESCINERIETSLVNYRFCRQKMAENLIDCEIIHLIQTETENVK